MLSKIISICIAFAFTLGCGAAQNAETRTEVVEEEIEERLDALVNTYVELGSFSGVILVGQGGDIKFHKAYGNASYELSVASAPKSRFRIASLSKQSTDTAIGTLIERGVITLDTHLSKYLPKFPRSDEITIRHLLDHTSGIPHTNNLNELDGVTRLSIDELVTILATKPLDFDPGMDSNYSNGGYAVLASVIEAASGISFEAYLKQYVFGPLGMNDTGVLTTYQVVPGLVDGYLPGRKVGERNQARFYPVELRPGGGSLYSTAGDIFKIFRATLGGAYFENEQASSIGGYDSAKRYEITGRSPGFVAKVFRDIPNDITIVSLANSYSWQISWGRRLYQAAINDPWETERFIIENRTLPQTDNMFLQGEYVWGNDDPIELSVNPAGMIAFFDKANDWDVVLVPLANDEYFHPFYDRICKFEGHKKAEVMACRSSVPSVDATALFVRVE